MKTTPKKIETVTVNEFAEAAGLTARRIRQLSIEEKRIPPIKKGRIELLAGLKSLVAFYQRTPEAMQAERLALVRATRETKQLELLAAQGKFIERAVAEATFRAYARRYHGFVKQHIENYAPIHRLELLRQLGAAPDISAKFLEGDLQASQNTIDRIEDECAKAATEKIPTHET